jgi:hypothetical protein
MTENDRRESTRQVNSKPGQDGQPLFEPGRWYRRDVLQARFAIGNHTWARWVAAGLTVCSPGTKAELVFTDDKLDKILRTPESKLPPPYESPHAAKNAARKK